MRIPIIGLVACAACTPIQTTASPPMPWLRGFAATASSDVVASSVAERIGQWQACDDPCTEYGGIQLVADVAPGAGTETVLASFSQGVVVLDSTGALLARGRGFEPTGSADELLAVSVGDAMLGTPVIAVSARVGGRRESEVWLHLYRIGRAQQLDLMFAAVVEDHDDQSDNVGTVTLVPAGLVYKAPRATTPDFWMFDRRTGRYLYRGTQAPEPKPPAAGSNAEVIVRARDLR